MVEILGVNVLAWLVAAVVNFLLGALWYSPIMFAQRWTDLVDLAEEEIERVAAGAYVGAALASLLASAVIGVFVAIADAQGDPLIALGIGFLAWVVAGVTALQNNLFEQKPIGLWVVNTGYTLVGYALIGLVHGGWP